MQALRSMAGLTRPAGYPPLNSKWCCSYVRELKESWANEDACHIETPNNHSSATTLPPDLPFLDDFRLPSLGRIGSDPLFRSCGLEDRLARCAPAAAMCR